MCVGWYGAEFEEAVGGLEDVIHDFKCLYYNKMNEDSSSRLTLTGMITHQLLAQDSLSSNLKHSNYATAIPNIDINTTYLYRMPMVVNNLNMRQ